MDVLPFSCWFASFFCILNMNTLSPIYIVNFNINYLVIKMQNKKKLSVRPEVQTTFIVSSECATQNTPHTPLPQWASPVNMRICVEGGGNMVWKPRGPSKNTNSSLATARPCDPGQGPHLCWPHREVRVGDTQKVESRYARNPGVSTQQAGLCLPSPLAWGGRKLILNIKTLELERI